MYAQVEKSKENSFPTKRQKSRSIANSVAQKKGNNQGFEFVDNRPETVAQRKLQELANNSPQAKQGAQLQLRANKHAAQQQQPIQKKGNTLKKSGTVVQRYVEIRAGDATYPTQKVKTGMFNSREATDDEKDKEFFIEQNDTPGSYYHEGVKGPEAVIRVSSNADLQVSNTKELAIQSGVEAKVFFATTEKIKAANKRLSGNIRLRATEKFLDIQAGRFTRKKLYQVEPYKKPNKTKGETMGQRGLEVRTPQRCNEMAEFVSGQVGLEGDAAKMVYNFLKDVLRGTGIDGVIEEYDNSLHEWQKSGSSASKSRVERATNTMIAHFTTQLTDPRHQPAMLERMRELHINGNMAPAISQAIVTFGLYREDLPERPAFLYHFGTVVAKSGEDYITIENYSTNQSPKTASAGDPRFYFKMFGKRDPIQTWHEAQTSTGDFIGAIFSFALK